MTCSVTVNLATAEIGMEVFVRNLDRAVDESELRQLFEPYGRVASVKIVKDSSTSQPVGFAFIRMAENSEAISAINALKGAELRGRQIEFNTPGSRFERRYVLEQRSEGRGETERRTEKEKR